MTTATKASVANAHCCPRCSGKGYVRDKTYLGNTSGTTTFKDCPECTETKEETKEDPNVMRGRPFSVKGCYSDKEK